MDKIIQEKPTVLVVDDAPDTLTLIAGLLKDAYRVKVSTDGEGAIRVATSGTPPDIILLDVMMPVMDGYEACRRLKESAATKDIPIIFLTAMSDIEDEVRGFSLGAVDYITKPISPPILKARIKNHLVLKKAGDYLRDKNAFLENEVKARTKEAIAMHRLTQYFSPKIAERLIAGDELNRVRRRNLTIFMADIRGFTRISDEVEPEDLFTMLNEYFNEMIKIVFSFEGTVGKCFGDTVMGFFGDPEDCPNQAELAVGMALQMQDKVRFINENDLLWKEHRLNIGIGINTGYVTVGNVGSEHHKDYVVIGPNVNLTTRLTEKAKPGRILVSSKTYNLIIDLFKTEDVGIIRAKGFDNPVQAYNILSSL